MTILRHNLQQFSSKLQVPEDLETSWLLILCPEGRRNFVIAANGTTKVELLPC